MFFLPWFVWGAISFTCTPGFLGSSWGYILYPFVCIEPGVWLSLFFFSGTRFSESVGWRHFAMTATANRWWYSLALFRDTIWYHFFLLIPAGL